ncbi:MAG TPA: class I SAM-dependent methyltransferase [Myxococcota bacterium]|nr:class I SAM-dependent methyltransferase [Myxococcota bacterium]
MNALDVDVTPPDARCYAPLAAVGLSPDPFDPIQDRACKLVDLYTLHVAIDLLRELADPALLARGASADDLLARGGYVAVFRPALGWLLGRAAAAGLDVRTPLPRTDRAAVRAACLAIAPSYVPAFTLMDEAAALYPRVARGEVNGDRALLMKASLWVAYFDNRNGYYALNNRVVAVAAAARAAGAGPARVLEVGAGLGSATEAVLGGLPAVERYHVTEPIAFFRRRAERTLRAAHPGVALEFGALDVNGRWAAQGVRPADHTFVVGVNVFHLARDLVATLREAFEALEPGGWLVAGEAIRPHPHACVGAELPFQILQSYHAVETDPELRPTPGFLTAEGWTEALGRAGFTEIALVPDAVRLRDLWESAITAAVCGRRPHA